MRVNFVANPVHIGGRDGWSPWDLRVGGSEECIINWATRLKERGHDVRVFHNGHHGNYMGVEFQDRRDYLDHAGTGVTVNVNYPDLRPLEPTIYWTSLTSQGGRDLSAFKEVFVISEYARDNTGLDHRLVSILPPGYEPEKVKPGHKIPGTVLYASSPDRGLAGLLKVWPDVVKRHPSAQLIVTYGGELDVPNAICLGEVSEAEMNRLYAESDIWCYPCTGGELYCMTGIKAQAAGCIPVYYPTMALAETVRAGCGTDEKHLASELISLLGNERRRETMREFIADKIKERPLPTWESTTDQLEAALVKYA